MKEIVITERIENQRFDKFLIRLLCNEKASFVYKMLRKKNITLNDKKADGKEILKTGDLVKIWFSDETYEALTSINKNNSNNYQKNKINNEINKNNKKVNSSSNNLSNINIESKIIYEDDNVLLINKPVGLLTQKAEVNDISLNELIIDYLFNKQKIKAEDLNFYKPSCVNRLDRNTSGIVVCAKNLKSAQILSEGFRNRTINKYYKCLVHGVLNKGELIKGYLYKDEKKNKVNITKTKDEANGDSSYIETEYSPLQIYDNNLKESYTLLNVHLITGKTHQIRAHLASIDHPLAGDKKYGVKDKYKYQCLHCYKIEFPEYDGLLKDISKKSFYGDMEKPWT